MRESAQGGRGLHLGEKRSASGGLSRPPLELGKLAGHILLECSLVKVEIQSYNMKLKVIMKILDFCQKS